jgi:hypothetical protein
MKTIQTPEGEIRLLEPPVELLRAIRAYLPYGMVRLKPPAGQAEFGIVMQCGDFEVMAIKQQSVDLDPESGELQFRSNHVLIAAALKSYLQNGFKGLLMPVPYRREKPGGRIEAGFAYFGSPSPTQGPLLEPQQRGFWADHFSEEFHSMIRRFIHALVEGAAATRLPIQEVIIGLDVRKRMQLDAIILSFMVLGNNLICLRATIDEREWTWSILRSAGITELYHLPSVSMAIRADELEKAKSDSQQGD